jgi:hypothetical protein
VVSSCDSGERGVRGSEAVMVEECDFADSECDGSINGQHKEREESQGEQKRFVDKRNMEVESQDSFCKTVVEESIPSKVLVEKTKGVGMLGGETIGEVEIRGLSSPNKVDSDRGEKGGTGADLVEQELTNLNGDIISNGPFPLGSGLRAEVVLERIDVGPVMVEDRVDPVCQVEHGEGISVIEKLDGLVEVAREKQRVHHSNSFTQEESNLSASSNYSQSQSLVEKNGCQKSSRTRKPMSRLPFPSLVGPKCLRLVEVVNSVGASCRRKKIAREEGRIQDTQQQSQADHSVREGEEDEICSENRADSQQNLIDDIALQRENRGISGVNLIMGNDSLEDVGGFIQNRKGTEAKRLEAEEILEIQEALGLTHTEGKEMTVKKLEELEDRDREKMARDEEGHGFQ